MKATDNINRLFILHADWAHLAHASLKRKIETITNTQALKRAAKISARLYPKG
jgi:hypothetical protein